MRLSFSSVAFIAPSSVTDSSASGAGESLAYDQWQDFAWVREAHSSRTQSGPSFHLIYPVPCELEAGNSETSRPEENVAVWFSYCTTSVNFSRFDAETTRLYRAALNVELRRKGRVLSQVDMMLAALARRHKLVVLTTDGNFQALSDLAVENWVV